MKTNKVVGSDLTVVKVKQRWMYLCIFIGWFHREIIGFSTGPHKDASLVVRAGASGAGDLRHIKLFLTDHGSKFTNQGIEETLPAFNIHDGSFLCINQIHIRELTFTLKM